MLGAKTHPAEALSGGDAGAASGTEAMRLRRDPAYPGRVAIAVAVVNKMSGNAREPIQFQLERVNFFTDGDGTF